MSYRPEVDGFRFIAVTLVLLFHLGFSDWNGGFIGVDIFFVISGYLICGQVYLALLKNAFHPLDFFARRIRRLSTAAFACFGVTALVSFFVFSPFEMNIVVRNLLGSISFTNNILLMREAGYFAPSAETNPYLHTWSLSIEEQFYIVLPLTLLLLRLRAHGFGIMLAACFAISLALTLFSGEKIYSHEERYFASILRVWQLALGGLTFILVHNLSRCPKIPGLPAIGLVALIYPATVISDANVHPGPWALVVGLGTSVMLLTAAPNQSWTARALASVVPRYLGKISYGTYLWHWPIVVFYQYLGGDFSDRTRSVAIIASFSLGAISHHFIETPIRRIAIAGNHRFWAKLFVVQTIILATIAGALWVRGNYADPKDAERLAALFENSSIGNDAWNKCWFEESGVNPCTFGELGGEARPIVLWGDSMANSALTALGQLADQNSTGGTLLTTPNCPPVYEAARDMSNAQTCLDANAAALAFLESAPPSDVFLLARWQHYGEGVRKNRWGPPAGVGFVDPDLNIIEGEPGEVLGRTFDALLKSIPDRHRVIVLGPAPEFPYSIPDEMIKNLRFGRTMEPFARSRFSARAERTSDILVSVAAANETEYIKLVDHFCDETHCMFERDGIPLFADSVHFSKEGNVFLYEILSEYLAPAP